MEIGHWRSSSLMCGSGNPAISAGDFRRPVVDGGSSTSGIPALIQSRSFAISVELGRSRKYFSSSPFGGQPSFMRRQKTPPRACCSPTIEDTGNANTISPPAGRRRTVRRWVGWRSAWQAPMRDSSQPTIIGAGRSNPPGGSHRLGTRVNRSWRIGKPNPSFCAGRASSLPEFAILRPAGN